MTPDPSTHDTSTHDLAPGRRTQRGSRHISVLLGATGAALGLWLGLTAPTVSPVSPTAAPSTVAAAGLDTPPPADAAPVAPIQSDTTTTRTNITRTDTTGMQAMAAELHPRGDGHGHHR